MHSLLKKSAILDSMHTSKYMLNHFNKTCIKNNSQVANSITSSHTHLVKHFWSWILSFCDLMGGKCLCVYLWCNTLLHKVKALNLTHFEPRHEQLCFKILQGRPRFLHKLQRTWATMLGVSGYNFRQEKKKKMDVDAYLKHYKTQMHKWLETFPKCLKTNAKDGNRCLRLNVYLSIMSVWSVLCGLLEVKWEKWGFYSARHPKCQCFHVWG